MAEKQPLHVKLVSTLLEIHKAGLSTIVRMTRGAEKKQLVIRAGNVVNAESGVPGDHLARILVEMELMPQAALKKTVELMKNGCTTDQAVQEAGGLGAEEVLKGAHLQAVRILASVFGWEDGDIRCFRFDGESKRRIDLQIPVPELLTSAVRSAARDGHLPGPIKALKMKLSPAAALNPALLALPLEPAETEAVVQVRDLCSLEEILPFLPRENPNPREVLQRLLLLGLIQLVDPQAIVSDVKTGLESALADQLGELLHAYETATFYEILAIRPDAAEDEVKTAYHELARRYHPDHFHAKERDPALRAKAEKVFTEIAGAYAVLSDPARRSGYDAQLSQRSSPVDAALQAKSAAAMEKEKIAETLYRAGKASLAQGGFEKAVELLRECVWAQPDVARYQHALAKAQSENPRQRKEAERHFLKAIELDKLMIEAYIDIARLYINVKLPRRAEVYLQQALHWSPGNPEAERLLRETAPK
jgi:curved DNA-binding protein CbpA